MQPIAIVNWSEDGREKRKDFYDMLTLSRFVDMLNRQGFVVITTMLSVTAPLPTTEPRRHITAI